MFGRLKTSSSIDDDGLGTGFLEVWKEMGLSFFLLPHDVLICIECVVYTFTKRYFAVSRKPKDYAEMMQEWSNKGYPGERDLFICRAVLHALSTNSRG